MSRIGEMEVTAPQTPSPGDNICNLQCEHFSRVEILKTKSGKIQVQFLKDWESQVPAEPIFKCSSNIIPIVSQEILKY